MDTDDSKIRQRLANNERLMRSGNKKIQRMIENHTPKDEQTNLEVDFECECSSLSCNERIALTVDEYEKLHKHKKQFVLVKGHEIPTIEKIVKDKDSFIIVEKLPLVA